ENAVAVALNMRENGGEQDLLERLAADERLPMSKEQLEEALADKHAFIGAAESQVDAGLSRIEELADQHPKAAAYPPGEILQELPSDTSGTLWAHALTFKACAHSFLIISTCPPVKSAISTK